MSKSGRRKTPTRVKEMRGTIRPDRVNRREPQPQPGPVRLPPGVLSDSARKVWNTWAPELQRLGLLTPLDAPMFTVVCAWAGVALDSAKLIREGGLIVKDEDDRVAKNRALTILRSASSELRMLSRCFGLTPADRADLETSDEDAPPLAVRLFELVTTPPEESDERSQDSESQIS